MKRRAKKCAAFLNARQSNEIIFTRGTTESINLVVSSYGRKNLKRGDEIIVTAMEHHSNIVPWQMLCEETGAVLRVIPINDAGELLLDEYEKLLNPRTKIVSVVHLSNALGTINPVKRIVDLAHQQRRGGAAGWRASRRRIFRLMCRRWTAISTRCQAIKSMAQPASEYSGARLNCWKRCRHIRAAAI